MANRIPKALRARIHAKYGGRCAYCGAPLGKGWHVDHREPLMRHMGGIEGRDDESNLEPACPPCNRLKGVASVEEFRERVARQLNACRRIAAYRTCVRYEIVAELETTPFITFWFEEVEATK